MRTANVTSRPAVSCPSAARLALEGVVTALGAAATLLVVIGMAHSLLGEMVIIRPLLADGRWATRLGSLASGRVARFAWHLTTVAWWTLAAVAWGAPIGLALAVLGGVSAAAILTMLPGHLAWPGFVAIAVLGFAAAADATWDTEAWAVAAVGLGGFVGLGLASRRFGLQTWPGLLRPGSTRHRPRDEQEPY